MAITINDRLASFISVYRQVNLFKKGLGVGVPGNQHDNTYAQGEIQRQNSVRDAQIYLKTKIFVILFSRKLLNLVNLEKIYVFQNLMTLM